MSNYSLVLLVSPLNVCQIISHLPYPLSQLKFRFYSFLTWVIPPRQGILHTGHLSGLPKISPLLLEIQQQTLMPLGLQWNSLRRHFKATYDLAPEMAYAKLLAQYPEQKKYNKCSHYCHYYYIAWRWKEFGRAGEWTSSVWWLGIWNMHQTLSGSSQDTELGWLGGGWLEISFLFIERRPF